MAVITGGFNPAGATNGATISTADAGDLTAWQATAGTPTYDNTHTLFGKSLAAKFSSTGSSQFVEWTTSYGSTTSSFGRLYVYFTVLPTGVNLAITNTVTNPSLRIGVDTSGHLVLMSGSGTVLATSTTVLSTGSWYRIEWQFTTGPGCTAKLFSSPDSTTLTESITTATLLGTPTGIAFGVTVNSCTSTFWLGQVVEKATAYPGPFPVNSVAPAVTGSSTAGSTLTCDGGTWNGTFTLGYQWTSNGTNISGATSSTYVTQAGDAGNAIGCTVTATGQQATNESAAQASGNTITVTSSGGGGGSSTLALASHPGRFLLQKGIR